MRCGQNRHTRSFMQIATIIFIFLFLSVPAGAAMYKWTDESGNLHITDSINKVPEKYRSGKTTISTTRVRPETTQDPLKESFIETGDVNTDYPGSPSEVYLAYHAAVMNDRCKDAADYLTGSSLYYFNLMYVDGRRSCFKEYSEIYKNGKIVDKTIEPYSAVLTIAMKRNNAIKSGQVDLVHFGGKWKIDFQVTKNDEERRKKRSIDRKRDAGLERRDRKKSELIN